MGWVKERKMKELWQKGEDVGGGGGGFISTLPGSSLDYSASETTTP